jgi:hypothetical protein
MGTIFSLQKVYQMPKTMKCYLLLRDNVESGPYNLEELSVRKLLPTDLIWVEGSSHSWRFPAEIEALAHLVQHQKPENGPKQEENKELTDTKSVFVALPPQPVNQAHADLNKKIEEPELETVFEQPLENLKWQYQKHIEQRKFRFAKNTTAQRGLWMAALFAGLLAGAFMIKKMVDSASLKDQSIISAAAMPANAYPQDGQKEAEAAYHNALTTEVVPVDTATAKPKVAKKVVNLKKQVTLTASEFKRGVFGGINDLELKVKNKSAHVLDKVTIEVAYLKPNGDVISKETYSIKAVAPKSTKNITIPPSKRGVDIKYRILNIQSHEATAAMREL